MKKFKDLLKQEMLQERLHKLKQNEKICNLYKSMMIDGLHGKLDMNSRMINTEAVTLN